MSVTTSIIDETLLVTIDRPPVNALDLETVTAFEAAFTEAERKTPGKGVVISGSGEVFSAGVDVRAFGGYGRDRRHEMVRAITRTVARLLAIPVPVVAAVNGHALGGGFVLVLACDYRIATDAETARLGMTEAKAGIPFPAGPLEVIRHELAPELLRRLTLSSAVLGTRELLEARVIDELCAEGGQAARDRGRKQPRATAGIRYGEAANSWWGCGARGRACSQRPGCIPRCLRLIAAPRVTFPAHRDCKAFGKESLKVPR